MAQSLKPWKAGDLSSYPWLPGKSQVLSKTSTILAQRMDIRFSRGTEPIE